MPVVMQPAAPGVRATASARSALASSSSSLRARGGMPATTEPITGGGAPTGYDGGDDDNATVPMPRSKSRVVFDPEPMGPASGGTTDVGGGRSQQAPGWFSGPYKDAGRVSNARDTIERMANR